MRAQGGFTLIEIMVVLLIIAGLAYIVGTNVIGRFGEAKKEETKIQIKNLESALKLFKLDNGFYPETQQGISALIQPPTVGREPCCYARDGYLEGNQVPLDGWKNEYIYIGPDQTGDGTYEIISIGEDAVQQTEDDISSRNIQ
ncbi:MAG: type II secretion system major pseudopilin GspG [Deltaproteobacteria bacterium]